MTMDTVELRKIQYAQELAAYTMRQWMLLRDDPEPKHGSSPANGPTPSTQNTTSSSGRQARDDISSMCPSSDPRSVGRLTVLLQPYSVPPLMLSPSLCLSIAPGNLNGR
jgi:hypothetical protein